MLQSQRKHDTLQELCRGYLRNLRDIATRHGLDKWVDKTIQDNVRGKCVGTEEECEMLSRMIDDERLTRLDIPKLLGKSYRRCFEDEDFEKIKKLRNVGIYSKVNALLYKSKIKKESNKNERHG